VAHLDVSSSLPPDALRERLNGKLPADINVLAAAIVPHRFHARHDAVARRYVYQVALRRTAFAKPFVWWVKDPLDVARMRQAAAAFVGMHDFTAFANTGRGPRAEPDSNGDHEPSSRVLIERLDIEPQGDLVLIGVEGSHFLWRMVRRMVGVLVEIGRGGLAPGAAAARPASPFDAAAGLLASPSNLPARLTAPASGLFLDRVYYKGDSRDVPLAAATPLAVSRPSVVPSTRRTTSA
jgi:tRNA pseudouridine38-40 synthase